MEPPGDRRLHRKRRAFWKRRRFWIGVVATLIAIFLVLWLIGSLGHPHGEVD